MSLYLLDTNIPSELIKKQPNQKVIEWVSLQEKSSLYISVITLGEIQKGIAYLNTGKRRNELESWFKHEFIEWFSGKILPITDNIAIRWGIFDAKRKLTGTPLNTADGLIAATAFEHNFTLVTRNTKDFEKLGVKLFNPWQL